MTISWSTFRRILLMLLMTAALTLLGADALAATATDLAPAAEDQPCARDITAQCLLNGHLENGSVDQMRDGNYRTFWESAVNHGVCSLTVTPPEDTPAAGVLIRWRSEPCPVWVQVAGADGEWTTAVAADGDFYAKYIALPGLSEFRIVRADGLNRKLQICELTVYSEGVLPSDVQLWHSAPETVDMMLIAGHPDDEVLWFGGLLPTYAGERAKDVLVVLTSPNAYHRRLELLDSLWTCGVTIHPIIVGYNDKCTNDMQIVYKAWGGRTRVVQYFTALYRQYEPQVVVLHDVKGEYGHGVHRACSDAGRKAAEAAADPTQFTESAELYGVWDVPKVYVHLYAENQLTMDWHTPLAHFGGLTGQEVARQAFACHVSQQGKQWQVEDGGLWDNSLFGLWHTGVGLDTDKNDLFEHIE